MFKPYRIPIDDPMLNLRQSLAYINMDIYYY